MKPILILFASLSILQLSGQKMSPAFDHGIDQLHPVEIRKAHQWFPKTEISGDNILVPIAAEILKEMPECEGSEFRILETKKSAAGEYIHIQQFIDRQPVYNARGVAFIRNDGQLRTITANFYPTQWKRENAIVAPQECAELSDLYTTPNLGYWFYTGEALEPAERKILHGNQGEFKELLVGAEGEILFENDLNAYIDTVITVSVFDPDPLTTFGVNYGAPYTDQSDQNTLILDAAQVLKTVQARYDSGMFKLSNPHITLTDFSSPYNAPAKRADDQFVYSRNQSGFEDVMVFYHITTFKEHMQSLGFNLMNYSIRVDPHALGGVDNSMFSPNGDSLSPGLLYFGIGGVDDAEDADVILHELGHAVTHDASPWSNNGVERKTLDEAFGDYLAASYSKHIDPFAYERIYTWDGHNEFWPGRWGNNPDNKQYTNITFSFIYEHTDLWVDAMMAIWDTLGRNYTDKMALEAAYGYANNMSFTQAAHLVVNADQTFTGGANLNAIWTAFSARKILPPLSVDEADNPAKIIIRGTQNFATGGGLTVMMDTSRNYNFYFTDVHGRELDSGSIDPGTALWKFSRGTLSGGMYFLTLCDQYGNCHTGKLLRLP